jgi:hypothetical protein
VKRKQELLDVFSTPSTAVRKGADQPEWTDREREDVGFELLAAAMKQLDDADLADFRDLRRVGADSVDNLRRFFELKAYEGEMPDTVRFEATQHERASRARSAFFLAVVAGLEEGKPTVIRIISNPLGELEWRRTSSLTLAGVKSARALEIPIEVSSSTTNGG